MSKLHANFCFAWVPPAGQVKSNALSRFYGSTEGLPLTKVFIVVQLRCPKSTNLENSNCTSHHQPNSSCESRSSSLSLSLDNYQLKVFFELFSNRRKNFLLWFIIIFLIDLKINKLKACRKMSKMYKLVFYQWHFLFCCSELILNWVFLFIVQLHLALLNKNIA